MTVPIYLAECSPVHLRGRLTVADNMAITGGQFVAGVVDYAFSYVAHGWRYCISTFYYYEYPLTELLRKCTSLVVVLKLSGDCEIALRIPLLKLLSFVVKILS